MFSLQHGVLKDVRLVTYRSGQPKGLAYIEYVDEVRLQYFHDYSWIGVLRDVERYYSNKRKIKDLVSNVHFLWGFIKDFGLIDGLLWV